MGLPEGNQAIWTPSPVQWLTGDPGELTPVLGLASDCSAQSDCRGSWRNSTRVCCPGNLLEEEKGASTGEGEWHSKRDTSQVFPPLTCYPTHGKKLAQRGDCKISRRCSCRPACSSANVCQRGAVHQRIGGDNTTSGVSPHPQGAQLALRLVRQSDGIHYPVGQPLLGDSLPFLLTIVADKELLSASKLRVRSTYMRSALTGHSSANG